MKSFAARSIAFKLSFVALASLLVVLLTTMALVSSMVWSSFGAASRGDARQYASQVSTLVKTMDESAQQLALRDFGLLKANFPGAFSLAEQPGADGKPEAVLSFQGVPVNGDFEVVDRFSADAKGAVATIFARTGDDFIRVTTSLKKQDGERAFKTLLDRKHPAYALMAEGKPYIGRANLFGRDYMTVYEPIREGNRTIGILFIGSDIAPILSSLSELMASRKLFDTGAVYAVDVSSGPARGRIAGLGALAPHWSLTRRSTRAKPGWRRSPARSGPAISRPPGRRAPPAKPLRAALSPWSVTSPGTGPSWLKRRLLSSWARHAAH